jgi:hypothetical protein
MAELFRFRDCTALHENRLNVHNHEIAAIPLSNHNGLKVILKDTNAHILSTIGQYKCYTANIRCVASLYP